MTRARLDLAALAGAMVWGLGAWCASGTIALAPDGVGRLGVLPPLWWLGALAALAVAIIVVRRTTGRQAAPLWVPALAVLPWLPLPLPPAALLAVGPFGLVFAAAALAAMVPFRPGIARVRSAAAAAPLVAIFLLSAWWIAPRIPGGDEPHYLIITQSLLHDGDLRIEDNHQRREFVSYVEGELRPDYLRRGKDGAIYSIHAPGTAAVVLPAFAVAGYPGVVLWLSLLSAAGLVVAWQAASAAGGGPAAGMFGAAAVGLSVPFFFQAFTIYPDGLAAIAVITVVWLAVARPGGLSMRAALACGVLLGALPWLHTRYAAIAGPLGLVVLGRILWPVPGAAPPVARTARLAALLLPAALSAGGWLWMFQAIYGVWDPRAPYGHATDMRLARIPHGISGLLLDQQFGLLPNAPVYVLAFAGLATLFRYRRRLAIELSLWTVPYVLAVAGFHMWWAGRSSPARFLVPVLLPLAVPIAAWWATRQTRTERSLGVVALVASLLLTTAFVVVDRGALVYNIRDGYSLWLLAASPIVNLTYAFPSLFQAGPPHAWALAGVWTVAGLVGWFLLRRVELGGAAHGPWQAAGLLAAAAIAAAGSTAGWAFTGARPADDGSAMLDVLGRACETSSLVFDTGAFAASPGSQVLTGLPVPDASRRLAPRGSARWSGADVPPGRYRVALDSPRTMSGSLEIALGRPDAVMSRCNVPGQRAGMTPCEVSLPAGAAGLWVTADRQLARSAERVVMVVEAQGAPELCDARAHRALVHEAGTWFVTGGQAWVESRGLWTAGGGAVEMVVDGPPPARVRIRAGAVPGRVALRADGWSDQRQLSAGETWELDVPPGATGRPRRITIASDSGFRPADHEPGSADTRLLGVWVEPG